MSSTVTNYSNNINVLYPVPGVDNDTQGFRDNFANIKNALQAASEELSYLELNTAKLNTSTNDYNYSGEIYRAPLRASGHTAPPEELITTSTNNISFLSGSYKRIAVQNNIQLGVSNWPISNIYSKVVFDIRNNNTSPAAVSFSGNGNTLKKDSSFAQPFSLSTSPDVSHVFEMWTADGGDNVFVTFVGTFTNV